MQTGSVSNDMSLMELLEIFYQHKKLIFLGTFLGLITGLLVIFFSTPLFEAKIKLFAATEGDIAPLNLGRSWNKSPLKPLTQKDVYYGFNESLLADSVKEAFFKQFYEPILIARTPKPRLQAKLHALFLKNFAIAVNPVAPAQRFHKYTVAIRDKNAQQAALWLKQFVNLVREHTLNALLDDMKQQRLVLIENIEQQINIARHAAKAQREDQVAQLKKQINLAQLDPSKILAQGTTTDATPRSVDAKAVLEAEIERLTSELYDNLYIPNLHELEAQVQYYKSFKINTEQVSLFHLDGLITVPQTPIFPKKGLIMMVSLILGTMAGIFWILIPLAWRKNRAVA